MTISLQALHRRWPAHRRCCSLDWGSRRDRTHPCSTACRVRGPSTQPLAVRKPSAFCVRSRRSLEESGFALLVPPWWNQQGARLGVRLRLRGSHKGAADGVPSGALSLDNLVRYRWELAIGDTPSAVRSSRRWLPSNHPLYRSVGSGYVSTRSRSSRPFVSGKSRARNGKSACSTRWLSAWAPKRRTDCP